MREVRRSAVGVVFALLALVGIASFADGFRIVEVSSPVGLRDVPLEVAFRVEFSRDDDVYDVISSSVTDASGTILAAENGSIFDSEGARRVEFNFPRVLLQSTGKQTLTINATLLASSHTSTASVLRDFSIWVIPGVLTLFPLLITMTIAAATRNVFPALVFGVFVASFLTYEYNLATSFARVLDSIILEVLTKSRNQLIILFAMTMGGFVHMINESRGSHGLAGLLSRFAKSSRSTQIVALLFCFLIFFDDYASALIAGATLRPIADKMGVSREKFCFIVDAGSAADAALIPITSWTSFLASLLQAEADKLLEDGVNLTKLGFEQSGFMALLRMLKYAYYSIFLIMFQIIIIMTRREFGPMFIAERRAWLFGVKDMVKGPAESKEDDPLKPPPRWFNAAIPIGFFAIYTIIALVVLGAASVPAHETIAVHNIFSNVDSIMVMYYSATLSSIIAAILYRCQYFTPRLALRAPDSADNRGPLALDTSVQEAPVASQVAPEEPETTIFDGNVKPRPVVTFNRSIEVFIDGFSHMTSTIMILVLAWSIGYSVDYLGAGRYIATTFEREVPASALPALIYLVCCIISFATGTSWGTMALMYPICGPIAFILSNGNSELYYCSMAAILEGAVFGDHCSFISDTTIMAASACRCPLDAHVITQIPYAFFVSFTCLFCGYLPIGMQTLPVGLTYVVGFATMFVGVLLLGAHPEGDRLDMVSRLSVAVRVKCCRRQRETMDEVTLMSVERTPGIGGGDNSKRQSLEINASVDDLQSPFGNILRRRTFDKEHEEERRTQQQEDTRAKWERKQQLEMFARASTSKEPKSNPFDFEFNDISGSGDDYQQPSSTHRSGADNSRHLTML